MESDLDGPHVKMAGQSAQRAGTRSFFEQSYTLLFSLAPSNSKFNIPPVVNCTVKSRVANTHDRKMPKPKMPNGYTTGISRLNRRYTICLCPGFSLVIWCRLAWCTARRQPDSPFVRSTSQPRQYSGYLTSIYIKVWGSRRGGWGLCSIFDLILSVQVVRPPQTRSKSFQVLDKSFPYQSRHQLRRRWCGWAGSIIDATTLLNNTFVGYLSLGSMRSLGSPH